MRTMLLLTLTILAGSASAADDPEPKSKVWLEVTLPPLGVPAEGKKDPILEVSRVDLKKYADRAEPKSPLRPAARAALVALWASSPEKAPAELRADVAAAKKRFRLDPTLKTRIP